MDGRGIRGSNETIRLLSFARHMMNVLLADHHVQDENAL